MTEMQNDRLATLGVLAQKAPELGRTACMKLCYFLQTLRDVPLGYRFTLYSYGPFDSSVLSDLSTAESLGGIQSRVVQFPCGYRHEIEPTGRTRSLIALAADFVEQYSEDIEWVVSTFASFRSADLELLSTIVYVDRESEEAEEVLTISGIIQKVHELKPNFKETYIAEKVSHLLKLGLLRSIKSSKLAKRN